MLNIIKADFGISKKNIIFILIYYLIFTGLFSDCSFVVMLIGISVYMLIFGLIFAEERDNISMLHRTLPVSEKAIIGAKYIESILIIFVSLGFVQATRYVFLQFMPNYTPVGVHNMLIAVITSALLSAVFIPVVYKFGIEKSRYIVIICWLGVSAAVAPLMYISGDRPATSSIILIICTALSLLVLIPSWMISVKIYKNAI